MLKFLRFSIGGFFNGYDEVRLQIYKHTAKYEILFMGHSRMKEYHLYEEKRLPVKNLDRLSEWETLNVNTWSDEYYTPVCDGTQWELTYREEGKKTRHISGSNAFPPKWNQFMEWRDALMPEMRFRDNIEVKEIDDDENDYNSKLKKE